MVTHIRNANEFNIIIVFFDFKNIPKNPYLANGFKKKETLTFIY
jgi:hypothetical protein